MNLERILLEPGWGLTGHAVDALILLIAMLTTSSLAARARQGEGASRDRGAGGGNRRPGMIAHHPGAPPAPLARDGTHPLEAFVLRMVLGQIATLPFVAAGVALLTRGKVAPNESKAPLTAGKRRSNCW